LKEYKNRVGDTIWFIADNIGSYPKATRINSSNSMMSTSSFLIRTTDDKTGKYITHDEKETLLFQPVTDNFLNIDSFVPSESYIQAAIKQLYYDFTFLSKVGAKTLMLVYHNQYAICHHHMIEIIKTLKLSDTKTTPVALSESENQEDAIL
jgi:hypothetical protein